MSEESPVKRWAAKRKATVVIGIFKGKTTAAEVARRYDLTLSEALFRTCKYVRIIRSTASPT